MPQPSCSAFRLVVLTLLAAWLVPLGHAQAPELRGELAEVRVQGTEAYADIVRTLITARAGTPVERIDLEAERNRVYSLGTFERVTLSLLDEPSGPVLLIEVEENPPIGEIVFDGVESVDAARLRNALRREHLLQQGRVYNSIRGDDAIGSIQQIYRDEGFPFAPSVDLEVEAAPEFAERDEDSPVRLRYRVDERREVDEVRFEGSSVLEDEELERIFAGVEEQEAFELQRYRQAVQQVAERYAEHGYRQSGVNTTATTLQGGVLTVRFRELRIDSIDTSAIGVDADELSLQPGDLFNYDVLLEDVRSLAEGRSGDVRLVPRVTPAGEVRVAFEVGAPDTAGPIDEVRIEGNTVLSSERLTSLLTLEEGDTFTSTLAEEDFRRVYEAYLDEGYVIANRPDYNYLDGTYVQRVTEFRIGTYRLTYREGEPAVQEFVVLRELPDVGEVLNLDQIDAGLRRLLRQGAVRPVDRQILPGEAGAEDEVLVEVILEDAQTGLFQPAATYSTDAGFSASVSFSESNLWGRAHSLEAEVNGRTSDVGLLFGGSVRYSIPWLYLDAYDLMEVATSVSASLFSTVDADQALTAEGSTRILHPGKPDREANRVDVGEYVQRESGFSVSLSRRIEEDIALRLSTRASYNAITLEPPVPCEEDEDGNIVDGDRCSLPREHAEAYLPAGGLSSFMSAALEYEGRDSTEFPRSGVFASGLLGVGIGNDFRDESGERRLYAYEQVEFGVRTYTTMQRIAPEEIPDPNHVLAVRLNGGHQLGGPYPPSKRFRVGRTSNLATKVRGYQREDFDPSRSYLTGSVEYRYDFGFSTFATDTVIAVAFADVGWASSVPQYPEYETPLFAGAGVGLQINLGFSGVSLPALRFDYAFSQRHPTGVFSFGIGPVF